MTPDEQARLARVEVKTDFLAEDVKETKEDIKDVKRDLKVVVDAIQETRGGWKYLSAALTVAASMGAAADFLIRVFVFGR